MNRLTLFADVAGRVSVRTAGAPRVTVAAVVVHTADVPKLREELGNGLPKWGRCSYEDAERAVTLLAKSSVGVGVLSINKDTESWRQFAQDAQILQNAILRESRTAAGWAKPSVILRSILLTGAAAIATGHAVRVDRTPRIISTDGLAHIDRQLIFDAEVDGDENIEVFRSFLERESSPWMFAKLGVRLPAPVVSLSKEEDEPLLLLADYAAGISHSALLPEPGRIPLPVPHEQAKALIGKLTELGKIAVEDVEFSHSYDEIFGVAMRIARERSAV